MLVMQHTGSHERFIHHVVADVVKTRKLRREKKGKERRRLWEMEEASGKNGSVEESTLLAATSGARALTSEEPNDDRREDIEILTPHTAFNKVATKIGGHYSSLERCLLLAGMLRAFCARQLPRLLANG